MSKQNHKVLCTRFQYQYCPRACLFQLLCNIPYRATSVSQGFRTLRDPRLMMAQRWKPRRGLWTHLPCAVCPKQVGRKAALPTSSF